MNSYLKALAIAKKAHANQLDLSGKPYINHPLWVAKHVKGKKTKIIALLHDVLEDSDLTLAELKKHFSKDICDAVEVLTRKDHQFYSLYIKEIKKNPLAKKVKIADLEHNMDLTRLGHVSKEDVERVLKYCAAYEELTNE